MTKFFIALVALMTMSAKVSAISLTFKFDVNSSGPSIYACNAGLVHKPNEERICYDRTTLDSCNPALCEEGEACNCVCTGDILTDTDTGEYMYDFLTAMSADWTDNQEELGPETKHVLKAGVENFNMLFSNPDSFEKQLTHLEFNLASERYGAKYFLDVCYRGADIDFTALADANIALSYLVKSQVTVTDIADGDAPKYQNVADLILKTKVVCDYTPMDNWAGAYANNVKNWDLDFEEGNLKVIHNNFPFATADVATGNQLFTWGDGFAPSTCKIRYVFREKSNEIRKWKKQKARVCTRSAISVHEDFE